MDGSNLAKRVKMKGLELGFSHVGIIPCHDFSEYAAEVASRPAYRYFVEKPGSFYEGCFPSKYFPQGKSIVCATYGFGDVDYPEELTRHIGRIYLARCYVPTPESIAGRRVTAMAEYLQSLGMDVFDNSIELPVRPAAVEAGIVQYGVNNFVRTKEDGSFVVIYAWIVDAEMEYDVPRAGGECPESCRRCIDACPTQAIEAPRRLNPMRCVLMNDLSVPMNPEVEDSMGERMHGCDVCQEVCPRNHAVLKGPKRKDPFLEALKDEFDLEKVLFLESFEDDYYTSVVYPIMYNYIRDPEVFRRNAAVAMGNSGDASYLSALERAIEAFPGSPTEGAARRAIEKLRGV